MKREYIFELQQGSDEWLQARCGVVTASVVKQLLTPQGKVAKNATSRSLVYEIAAQRLTGHVEESYISYDMERGKIQEEFARDAYSEVYAPVQECGFITLEDEGIKIGASPDGLVGEDGGIEIKSRLAKFQVSTITNGGVPSEYMCQIQTTLLVSGREWWDFVQYSNGMPLYVERVYPDQVYQVNISTPVRPLRVGLLSVWTLKR